MTDKFLQYAFLLLSFGILLFACTEEVGTIRDVEIPDTVDEVIPEGDEQYLQLNSDYIFDQDRLHTFELTLSDAARAEIDANPAAENYVEGSLTFEGETISPVGIRYKGSIGFVGCVSGSDWANPSGHKICTKLSMKVKLNWKDKDDKFYDLQKLQFHSQNQDDSQMRDRLGYWLFREMGVPAPRSVHVRLVINGVYTGLYALVEQVDGRFTRENFEDGSGNLYKEIWPLNENGDPYSVSTYLNHLETNEDENPSAEIIRTFGMDVANASDETIKSVIDQWMNIDEIIAYAVVDRTIKVDDGPFHWYCGGTCSNHNYYWYEEPASRTMHLIPWDLDNAFENILSARNPVTPIKDAWGEITNDCEPFPYGLFNLRQRSAACDKLTAGWVQFDEEYNEIRQEFIAGPLAEERVNAQLNKWETQIRDATIEASELHSDAVSISKWESALRDLKASLRFARHQ